MAAHRMTSLALLAIAALCKAVFGMRVDEETETTGLDLAQHGERAYDMSS